MALLAVAACTKEITADKSDSRVNPVQSGKITVNVEALMGELTPAGDETKSSISPVVRLTWENTDVVYAYDATQCLGSLTVTPAGNGTSAKLSGEITSTDATKITLVHCNTADEAPAVTDGAISFDLSNQGEGGDPFVVWGTLDNSKQTNIDDQVVPFHFATSLMRIAVIGLDETIDKVDSVFLKGVNTVCSLTLNANASPEVSGDSTGTIRKTGADNFPKENEKSIFTVSVVKDDNTDRKITVAQGTKFYASEFSGSPIDTSKSYVTAYTVAEAEGSRGKINGHDYVLFNGKRWATQNLTAHSTSPGNIPFNDAIVPGTVDEKVKVGDYFQWGASYTGYGVTENQHPDSLLNYSAISKEVRFDGKMDKQAVFTLLPNSDRTPFYDITNHDYTKYQGTGEGRDGRTVLEPDDDAARLLWGGSWRIPTAEELVDLCSCCYVEWDDVHKGLVFYLAREESHKGKYFVKLGENQLKMELKQGEKVYTNYSGEEKDFPSEDEYTPADALLFFPVAGFIENENLEQAGIQGAYWLGSVQSVEIRDGTNLFVAYLLTLPPGSEISRDHGCSIRPVSD